MKKWFLLSLCLLSGLLINVNAQQVLVEDFEGLFPPTGWTIDAHSSNWTADPSTYAGCTAPEAVMSWSPEFSGISRLISPIVDLTGNTKVLLQFNHYIDHYDGSYQLGVATRSNGGAWTDAWNLTVTNSIGATTVMVPISDANVNSSTFQFCIYFSGSSYNLNSWAIDNIFLYIPAVLDGAVTSLNVPTYFIGSQEVKGVINNMGLTNITSFNLNWQIEGGEVNTDAISGQNIALGGAYEFTSTHLMTPEAGVQDLKVWISNINGTTVPDNNPANDSITKTLRIPTQTLPRVPLFEEFTSSTCSPCASFNGSVFNPFIATNGDQLVLVKYQMDWPGNGDPYYTEEGGQRRGYYGVNAVPMLYCDGKNVPTSSTGVNNAFSNSLSTPAFVDFNSYYSIIGDSVKIHGQFLSYADLVDATLYAVIFEGVTTQNVASNGETEFHHVMMRILPDGNGTGIDVIQNGEPFTFDHTVDMTNTNVEEMSDLQVAVFLQDNVTKEIFQASYSRLSGVGLEIINPQELSIYPNPVKDQINIKVPFGFGAISSLEVIDVTGTLVKTIAGQSQTGTIQLVNEFPAGMYFLRVKGLNKELMCKFISSK